MTTTTHDDVFSTRERMFSGPAVRLRWGSIFGGAVAAVSIGLMLYTLGWALGLSSLDPNDPGGFKGSSIFTGIWSLVVSWIALAVGGMVASRSAGSTSKVAGGIYGLVTWGVTTIAGTYFVVSMFSGMVSGAANVGASAVKAGGEAAAKAMGQAGGAAQAFGLDADDALQPVNQRLAQEGKPAITAVQLQDAAKSVVQQGIAAGRIDHELLVSSIASTTSLSRTDAEEISQRVETQFDAAKSRMSAQLESAKAQIQTQALKAGDATGKALWGVFAALFVGMLSAVFGAMVGVDARRRSIVQTDATGMVVDPMPA